MKTVYVDLWTQSSNFFGNDLTLLNKFPSCIVLQRTVLQNVVGVKLCHFSSAWFRRVFAFVQQCGCRLISGRCRLPNWDWDTDNLLRFLVASLIPSKHIPGSISMRTQLLLSKSFSVASSGSVLRWTTIWNLPFPLQQLTNLTQRGGVIREKLIVPQFVKKLHFTGLSPCDFHFIPKMKEPLRGTRFRTVPEILQAVDRSIRTLDTTGAAEGILRLPHRWQRVVHNAGDYIEGQ